MPRKRTTTYEVGYKKPPQHGQFQPGQSGNPRGRPKGTKNLASLLAKTLNEKVVVNENGGRRSISKLEAAVKQLVNKAASGDLKPIIQLLGLVQLAEARAEAGSPEPVALSQADREVLDHILERMKPGGEDDDHG